MWKPKFHKKNSKRPQSQQENVATVPMCLKVFFPVPEGFSKTFIMGRVGWGWEEWEEECPGLGWDRVSLVSTAGSAVFWVRYEDDVDNVLMF